MTTLARTDSDRANTPQSQAEHAIFATLAAFMARWRAHPRAKKIAVGFSGGLDSTVLLHALAQLEQRGTAAGTTETSPIKAIHVEHGLHPDSTKWATHCVKFATQLGVRATHLSVKVKSAGHGLEAAARRARYQAIAAHTGPDVLLLTAHHQADQAETVLMKILGGAGPRGAVAMQAFSERAEFLLARPFLGIAKAQIIAYAKLHDLRWIEDPSNYSPQFRRNQIRQLMPELTAIYPDAAITLSTYAELARCDRDLLEQQAQQALARCLSLDPAVLRLDCLHAEMPALQPWILRAWLSAHCVHSAALARASLALANATGGFGEVKTSKEYLVDGKAMEAHDYVRRFDDCLYYADETAVVRIAPTRWHAHTPLPVGRLGTLQFDVSSAAVSESIWLVSQRQGGERIQLPARLQRGKPHRHALKDILQQQRVPPWRRNQLILLSFADTGELACVLGICASARFQDWLKMHSTRLVHNN